MLPVQKINNALCWKSGLEIDGDGSYVCYAPKGSGLPTLDYLANAGASGNWYGIVTENGNPIIQGPNDPAPGYYISPTALGDPSKNYKDPTKYVDSCSYPYIVVPPELIHVAGVKLGDLCWVLHNGNEIGAIVADVGPHGKIGEGSVLLAVELGIPSSPKNGGVDSGVTFVLFPGTSQGWPVEYDWIQTESLNLLNAWGRSNLTAI